LTADAIAARDAKLDPAVLRVVAVVLLGPFMSKVSAQWIVSCTYSRSR
jgi:hypothetical protein